MKKSFVADPFPTRCFCGRSVHLLRNGPVTLLPSGHDCPAVDTQRQVLYTIQQERACGLVVQPRDVARRLRDWGVGACLDAQRIQEGETK